MRASQPGYTYASTCTLGEGQRDRDALAAASQVPLSYSLFINENIGMENLSNLPQVFS